MKDGLIVEKSAFLENSINGYSGNEKIIEFTNISKKFGVNLVIDNISFTIYKNDVFGIIGESGIGKQRYAK